MSDAEATPPDPGTRCGFVALLGAPNAGKSTLVNALVGQKVSIVTRKVQTTRFPVRGVAIHGPVQMVLVDTPGVFQPKRRLDRAMVAAAWGGAADADALVHVVDAPAAVRAARGDKVPPADRRTAEDVERVVTGLKSARAPAILALNKVDALERSNLLELSQAMFALGVYRDVAMISAEKSQGLERLKDLLGALMPPGPWHYPEDQAADAPLALMAAEVTREKVFLRLHEELPYQASVETDAWTERKDGSVRIDQTLFVTRDSHKAMAIGKGGETLKWISTAARKDLEQELERPVHLFLHVKVRSGWQDERARYRALGLDFDA
jgi:GTPase